VADNRMIGNSMVICAVELFLPLRFVIFDLKV
jgi:hypothetical protein